jgi:hypothetical protein
MPAAGSGSDCSMDTVEQQSFCPHCRNPFEIVHIKFAFGSTEMVACCPNCALAAPAKWGAKMEALDERETSGEISGGIWQRNATMLDLLNLRFKYFIAFLIGAVITAAALRHGFHVYGGFSREEIRADALTAVPFVVLTAILLLRKRR